VADLWGNDPVHPDADSYEKIAWFLQTNLANSEAKYTNPPAMLFTPARKKPHVDLSQHREDWVSGCPATLVRLEVPASSPSSKSHNSQWRFAYSDGKNTISGLRGGHARGGYRGHSHAGSRGGFHGGGFQGGGYRRPRGYTSSTRLKTRISRVNILLVTLNICQQ
jgi:hypothetical protein